MTKKADPRARVLMESVWLEVGRNRIEERWIADRHGWLGYQEPGKLVISPLNLVQTIIHEALHAAHPTWTERGVERATTRVWRELTDDDARRLYLAYAEKVTRIAKPISSKEPE